VRIAVRACFIQFVTRFQSLTPWMYLDRQGQVVVALDCLIEPIDCALSLDWIHRDGSGNVQVNEIGADWTRVKRNRILAHKGPGGAAPYTNILLSAKGLEEIVLGRLDAIEQMIARPQWRTWDQWPADVQLATLSMAWEEPNLPEVFPRLSKSLRNHNWSKCVQQCCFSTARRPDLVPRNWAHRRLFAAAAELTNNAEYETVHLVQNNEPTAA
jgi:hypothetical protein